ncbi:DsbE family thiol:disulfide interchange protein [Rhodobacter ferrooxidans]|uniref:Periplasmic protein thiol/disulphide oxidoreductase DsbE n=1 Tax=Rhodobacter ferrooxidans TaxID=371731 RepID=C8RZF9_9RHOB|nr:DsbE family thiol:disulfide interchange protein [Rhodobacter sp. SW2]EEW25756.1 periplasmic protein thiol/disulphide oxidoreductase DsbE [Rhodobacter sp. SW2]
MAKALMFIPPVLFAGLAAVFYIGMSQDDRNSLPSMLVQKPAPALQVTALGDMAGFTDETLRQPGVKLVNFWASWCAACRDEHPVLMALQAEGIPIYGVAYKDKPEAALGLLAQNGNPYDAQVADPQGRTGLDFGVYGVPETFVIDGSGKILARIAGPISDQNLTDVIRPALAAEPATASN